jgi:hypothetical protein
VGAIARANLRFLLDTPLRLERIPIGWNHPIDKNTLKINLLEHVLIGKVSQLFRNMLLAGGDREADQSQASK